MIKTWKRSQNAKTANLLKLLQAAIRSSIRNTFQRNNIMDVPPVSHPAWKNIVSGKVRHQFEFLASNLLLGYLALQVKRASSPETVQKCAQELHDIFVRNADLV